MSTFTPCPIVAQAVKRFGIALEEAGDLVADSTLECAPYCHQVKEALYNLRNATEDLEAVLEDSV